MEWDGIFILAAGLGTRLRPLTLIRPKPCIPVHGLSPLKRWLDAIEPLNPKTIVLNTHHLSQEVEREWSEAAPSKWHYAFSHEPEILDTGGGLRHAIKKIPGQGPILVLNGDILAAPPFEKLFENHSKNRPLCTTWINSSHFPKTVVCDSDHNILSFRNTKNGQGVFCGVYLIERKILEFILPRHPFPIITAMEHAIQSGEKIQAVVNDSPYWCDIGSIQMYWKLHLDADLRNLWAPGATLQNGCLAKGKGCAIDSRAHLKNAVLWDNVEIKSDARLENVIVTDGAVVSGQHHNQIITRNGTHPLTL